MTDWQTCSRFCLRSPHRKPASTCRRRYTIFVTIDAIDFVIPPCNPKTDNPKRRRELIQDCISELRGNFLKGLTEQIGLARDSDYSFPRHCYVKKDTQTVKEVTYEKPTQWWYKEDGIIYLRLTFGERKMHIPGKNPVIRVGAMDNLLPTLEKLHILVADGMFDDTIEKMTFVSR